MRPACHPLGHPRGREPRGILGPVKTTPTSVYRGLAPNGLRIREYPRTHAPLGSSTLSPTLRLPEEKPKVGEVRARHPQPCLSCGQHGRSADRRARRRDRWRDSRGCARQDRVTRRLRRSIRCRRSAATDAKTATRKSMVAPRMKIRQMALVTPEKPAHQIPPRPEPTRRRSSWHRTGAPAPGRCEHGREAAARATMPASATDEEGREPRASGGRQQAAEERPPSFTASAPRRSHQPETGRDHAPDRRPTTRRLAKRPAPHRQPRRGRAPGPRNRTETGYGGRNRCRRSRRRE